MTWGVENDEAVVERAGTASAAAKARGRLVPQRRFVRSPSYEKAMAEIFGRESSAFDAYARATKATGGPTTLDGFGEWLKANDPVTWARVQKLAPVLYFDFIGSVATEYVLTDIVITTSAWLPSMGGGFFDRTAWYDIELSSKRGEKRYKVDKKLRFDGSGRAELRFWGDSETARKQTAVPATYEIDVRFEFLANGAPLRVSTGRFQIDV
jgi:hypothetical protein